MIYDNAIIWLFLFAIVMAMFTVVYMNYWPLIGYLFAVLVGVCILLMIFVILFG